jgi:hypothetical protein
MRQFRTVVTEIATFPGQVRVRCLSAGPSARAGQYFLAQAPVPAQPFLRLAVFPAFPLIFHFPVDHPYAALEPGMELDLLGPVGVAPQWSAESTRLLVIAERPERVYAVVRDVLEKRGAVAWLWQDGVPEWAASLLPPAVEFHAGVLSVELVEWADRVLLDVPDPAEAAAQLRAARPWRPVDFVQAVLLPPTPCGTGACYACHVETARGKVLTCLEGPILPV